MDWYQELKELYQVIVLELLRSSQGRKQIKSRNNKYVIEPVTDCHDWSRSITCLIMSRLNNFPFLI